MNQTVLQAPLLEFPWGQSLVIYISKYKPQPQLAPLGVTTENSTTFYYSLEWNMKWRNKTFSISKQSLSGSSTVTHHKIESNRKFRQIFYSTLYFFRKIMLLSKQSAMSIIILTIFSIGHIRTIALIGISFLQKFPNVCLFVSSHLNNCCSPFICYKTLWKGLFHIVLISVGMWIGPLREIILAWRWGGWVSCFAKCCRSLTFQTHQWHSPTTITTAS